MPDNDTNFYSGHRDRLREKFVSNKLTEYEKLELLLAYAIPRRDVRPLARGLIKEFGGVYHVLTAPLESLMEFKGVGRNTAIFLKLVQDMMKIGHMGYMKENPIFHDEKTLHNYCRMSVAGKQVEELHVLYLDDNLKLIVDEIHTTGTFNSSAVYPREIARSALKHNARSVVMFHNHPTSINAFSQDDLEITIQTMAILESLGIGFYDHFLVANDIVYSMRASHMLDKSNK